MPVLPEPLYRGRAFAVKYELFDDADGLAPTDLSDANAAFVVTTSARSFVLPATINIETSLVEVSLTGVDTMNLYPTGSAKGQMQVAVGGSVFYRGNIELVIWDHVPADERTAASALTRITQHDLMPIETNDSVLPLAAAFGGGASSPSEPGEGMTAAQFVGLYWYFGQ